MKTKITIPASQLGDALAPLKAAGCRSVEMKAESSLLTLTASSLLPNDAAPDLSTLAVRSLEVPCSGPAASLVALEPLCALLARLGTENVEVELTSTKATLRHAKGFSTFRCPQTKLPEAPSSKRQAVLETTCGDLAAATAAASQALPKSEARVGLAAVSVQVSAGGGGMFSALDGHRIISVELPSSAWKAKATGPLALNPRAARFAGSFPAEERLILTWTENYLLVAAASVSVYYWGLPSQLTDVAGYLAGQKHGQAVFQSEGSSITEALGLVSSPTQGESRELELSVEKGELVLFVRSTAGAEGSAEARVSLAAAYPDAKLGAYNLSLFRDMVKAAGDTALLTFTRQGANTPLWSERPGFTALVMPYAENEAQGKKETERLKEAA